MAVQGMFIWGYSPEGLGTRDVASLVEAWGHQARAGHEDQSAEGVKIEALWVWWGLQWRGPSPADYRGLGSVASSSSEVRDGWAPTGNAFLTYFWVTERFWHADKKCDFYPVRKIDIFVWKQRCNNASGEVGSARDKTGRAGLYAIVQQKLAEGTRVSREGGVLPGYPWLRSCWGRKSPVGCRGEAPVGAWGPSPQTGISCFTVWA